LPLLTLQSVAKRYWRGPRESRVLRDASLTVAAGTLTSIYGPRNSGKTTLLKIAAGFEAPDRGAVRFDGCDLYELPERQLARVHRDQIAWVERGGPHMPELTVIDHVALPLYRRLGRSAAECRSLAMLERYGVAEYSRAAWSDLPDHARVLCAIAQATVRAPRLLIADDPTAGLGIIERERICAVLRAAAEQDGLAVLMAVPDMPAMLRAHRVLLLSRGRLLAPAQRGDGAAVIDFPPGRRSA
jgi:putative ABC transport system ATP-binding protein